MLFYKFYLILFSCFPFLQSLYLAYKDYFFFHQPVFFFTTVYTQYYFILVSGVQQSGWTIIYFTKCPPDISSTHWHRT